MRLVRSFAPVPAIVAVVVAIAASGGGGRVASLPMPTTPTVPTPDAAAEHSTPPVTTVVATPASPPAGLPPVTLPGPALDVAVPAVPVTLPDVTLPDQATTTATMPTLPDVAVAPPLQSPSDTPPTSPSDTPPTSPTQVSIPSVPLPDEIASPLVEDVPRTAGADVADTDSAAAGAADASGGVVTGAPADAAGGVDVGAPADPPADAATPVAIAERGATTDRVRRAVAAAHVEFARADALPRRTVPSGAGSHTEVDAGELCEDRGQLAPWLAAVLCPEVASSPAAAGGLLQSVFPVLGATVVALLIAGAVMVTGGLVLRRVGRMPANDEPLAALDDHDRL